MLHTRKAYGPSPAHIPATMRNTVPAGMPPSIKGLKILVVEDDAAARAMLVMTLETLEAVVTPASSVERALELLKEHEFDVMLSDIGMHGKDGIELIQHIRGRGNKMPAAALTAHESDEDVSAIMKAGYSMYLPKHIEMAYLVAAVADLAEMRGRDPDSKREVDSEYRRFDIKGRLKEYMDM
ncbi:MAG: hypothetical protein JWN98_1571 [Abditibacteriota bacterium]|nr:hypothetical protein [Abditibacteriota bacterium]